MFRPDLADNNSFEQWSTDGAFDMTQRANTLWKKRLEEYQDPGLDTAIDEELQAYIRRRKEETPDANFF